MRDKEYKKRYYDKNKADILEYHRMKMREYYKNRPEYRNKQFLIYYGKKYGYTTLEEIEQHKKRKELEKQESKRKQIEKFSKNGEFNKFVEQQKTKQI